MISEKRIQIASERCIFLAVRETRGHQPLLVELEAPGQLPAELDSHVLCVEVAEFWTPGMEHQHAFRCLSVRQGDCYRNQEQPTD
jgi:hypothetical protein